MKMKQYFFSFILKWEKLLMKELSNDFLKDKLEEAKIMNLKIKKKIKKDKLKKK